MKEIMKQEEKKLISILSLLVVISIIILIITIALPRLKRTEKEVAKQQVDKMKENYATNATDFGDISANGDGSVTASLSSDGVLRISGKGNMKNYTGSSDVPWYSVRTTIKSVVIESGVTSIGSSAFYYCSSLTQIEIPSGVTSIGSDAFENCYRNAADCHKYAVYKRLVS